jgi:hypothetical protein
MHNLSSMIAYFSPETLLPVGSILATVLGVAMMLGRGSLRFLLRCVRRVLKPADSIASVNRPHFRLDDNGEGEPAQASPSSHALETTVSN